MPDREQPRVALVVEDDLEQRCLIVAMLEETDLRVVDVDNAEEALTYLRDGAAERVALLFTDIRLPRSIDGVSLARAVYDAWPWISILVTSGNPGNRLDDLPDRATYMAKPWRALDILVEADRASKRLQARTAA